MGTIIVDSLIIVVLIILIFALLLVVFIPAILEFLSRRNRAQRDQRWADLRKLEREARQFERVLAPYRRTRSVAYQSRTILAQEKLTALTQEINGIQQLLEKVRCPVVYGYLLPAQHFVANPNHMGTIMADTRLLSEATSKLKNATRTTADFQAAFQIIGSLPAAMAMDRQTKAQRLADLEAIISKEQAEGIEALDDFLRDAATVRRLLLTWDQAVTPDAAISSLDEGAVALETAETTLNDAFSRAAALERERAALDRRLRRIVTELDNAQAATKSGPAAADTLPQVRPLLRRAAVLLNESAPDHRRRREFNAAGADVSTAAQLIAFGRDLATADQQIKVLADRDDGMSLSEAIAGLRRELGELLERMGLDDSGSAGGMTDAALAGRAAQVRTRAETLTRQQDEAIAELTREATVTRDHLEQAWLSGQSLLRLADDDPLARRYAHLLAQFTEAQRQPTALEQFRRDAAAFEGVWNPWTARIEGTKSRVGRIRSRLPDLIDQALALAAPWNCLAEDVAFIQQRAADFETIKARFTAVDHRREAEVIMDQIDAIETDIDDRFAQLKERASRLHFLESDIDQIIDLTSESMGELPAEHPDRPKWDRAARLIDHHARSAHAALHYEDASVALLRAADAANKLAL